MLLLLLRLSVAFLFSLFFQNVIRVHKQLRAVQFAVTVEVFDFKNRRNALGNHLPTHTGFVFIQTNTAIMIGVEILEDLIFDFLALGKRHNRGRAKQGNKSKRSFHHEISK